MQEPFNPDLFVAKWYCSKVGPEDMPKFAADALEAGYDGAALRQLAGLMKPTMREVGNLFQEALAEIGKVKVHSRQQAALFLSRLVATAIVEGNIDPIRGCSVLADYAFKSGYPPFLAEFEQLDGALEWGDHAPSRSELIEQIIEQARELVNNIPG
jgi:hypothetical protein